MAYARFARDCDWYVYWHATPEEAEPQLAVQHVTARGKVHLLSHGKVVAMLAARDFRDIPGRTPKDDALLEACFREFLEDLLRDP